MKKAVGLSAILGLLALAALLVPPPEVTASSCYECFTSFWRTTPGQWGMGASCAAAEADAIANAQNYAYGQCFDGVCAFGDSEIVTPCMWTGSQYKADATVEYQCWFYICPDQPQW